jgi:hypothetical protein
VLTIITSMPLPDPASEQLATSPDAKADGLLISQTWDGIFPGRRREVFECAPGASVIATDP